MQGLRMEKPNRKSPRLKGFDYTSANYYFVTFCTHERHPLFGNGEQLSELGLLAERELQKIPVHFPAVEILQYVIMPDHIHGIFSLGCRDGATASADSLSLSSVVGLYKSGVTRLAHEQGQQGPVWQRSFYDRIIRSEQEFLMIWQYIEENARIWRETRENNGRGGSVKTDPYEREIIQNKP